MNNATANETALYAAIETILAALIDTGVVTSAEMASVLSKQAKSFADRNDPEPALVLASIVERVCDPQREAQREAFRVLLREPPAGKA